MKKGSIVSKSTHPLSEVNEFRDKLVYRRLLRDMGDYYRCSKGISTGILMAYNLHAGELISALPEFDVVINENEDNEIIEASMFDSFYSADNGFLNRLEKDCFRIVKIIQASLDNDFFGRKGDSSLSKPEQFVVDVLREAAVIDKYRRGDPLKKECDIVDEKNGRQIEIVTYLDEKIPPNLRNSSPLAREQAIALENCDFGYNVVPNGVINKFTEKDYSNEYKKELAIYIIGDNNEAKRKFKAIETEILWRADRVKNNYKQIHLIIHDPLIEESVTYCSSDKCLSFHDTCCSVNLLRREEVSIEKIEDDAHYFLLRENIFDVNEKKGAWLSGRELRQFGLL